jgi:hypothetical protein
MEPARRGLQKIALELIRSSPESERPMIAWPLACGIAVAEKTLAALRQLLGDAVQRIEFIVP